MSATILGISAFYHDSAAALVQNGEIIAAAQEERFTRKKHDQRFPQNAINYCLAEAFIEPDELDAVVFYDHPILTLDRVLKNILQTAPDSEGQWMKAAASTLGHKLLVPQIIQNTLKADVPVFFTTHHLSHAASAFYPSPFESAAVIVADGVGEWASTSIGRGQGTQLELLQELRYPHSLGLLYSAMTYFCGFKVNSGEYKLMGLTPYGEPKYVAQIYDQLIHVKPDGSYQLNMDYFGFQLGNVMTSAKFDSLFEGPPRQPESRITKREMELAASIQVVAQDIMLKLAHQARRLTGEKNLVMAGGVALNCVANGVILREKIFENIWIQPASGDAGGALGAALVAAHTQFGAPRQPSAPQKDTQKGSYLGPKFSRDEVLSFLDRHHYPHEEHASPDQWANTIATALSEGKVVGFLSGRMEFGPRSLGARSILGDPRQIDTQVTMNLKIKYRESFRPFAPVVLADKAQDYFELETDSPYMLLVAPVKASRQRQVPALNQGEDLLEIVRQARSDIPAVTHVDYSARVQTLSPDVNPKLDRVMRSFEQKTGCAVLVNTSFNVRGEPIVCTPQDAYRCFMRTEMDILVLEDFILRKDQQPVFADQGDWRTEYELD